MGDLVVVVVVVGLEVDRGLEEEAAGGVVATGRLITGTPGDFLILEVQVLQTDLETLQDLSETPVHQTDLDTLRALLETRVQ